MLKVLFVLGCLLYLTLAYSDNSASRVERSPRGHQFPRGRGPPRDKNVRPCITEDVLQKLLEILRTTATTTTTAATTTAESTTTAATTTTTATAAA